MRNSAEIWINGYYFLTEGIQKNNDPVVAFSPATLEEMIDGDPASKKEFC